MFVQPKTLFCALRRIKLTTFKKKREDMVLRYIHIYKMKYNSAIKKWNFAICDNMYEPSGYYAKWNKSDRKRQVPYDFTYMWNLRNKTNKHNKTETDS